MWWSTSGDLITAHRIATATLPLLTLPFASFLPDLAYTPRGLIHGSQCLPLFVSPFAPPSTYIDVIPRLAQSYLLYRHVPSLLPLYAFSLLLGAVRALVGFIFTRSLGWAYPALFSHHTLYESTAGFGPLLVAWLIIREGRLDYTLPIITAGFCWSEQRPWTYGQTVCLAVIIRVLLGLRGRYFTTSSIDIQEKETLSTLPFLTKDVHEDRSTRHPALYIFLSLLTVVPFRFVPAYRTPFPPTSLDILMLSFPRPVGIDTSVGLIETTLNSFQPFLQDGITLSIFTHSSNHEALQQVTYNHPDITVYVDRDTHPDDADGHYLHLAEAFRWQNEKPAEWVMLIEDDFPVCPGGWGVIETVMDKLETERGRGEINAGFIGTGGSGIIIHRSYLPLLSMLLRTLSATHTNLPPNVKRRAPDQLIQDCLIGRKGSLCERNSGKATISSRLVLDHIGGLATTTQGKALNSDKWRCGWRHAFHGDDQVDVVVV